MYSITTIQYAVVGKMKIESLIFNTNDALELAKDYIKRVIMNDDYLKKNFAQIMRYVKGCQVRRNLLCLRTGDIPQFPIEITLPNRLGINQRAEIIKNLNHYGYSYELRLDDVYKHYRIIFFVHQIDEDSSVFSFGFTKDGEDSSDVTNLAAEETLRIRLRVLNGEKDRLIC